MIFLNYPKIYCQNTFQGGQKDGYYTRFNKSTKQLKHSTYIGGNNKDKGRTVLMDFGGIIYVGGVTYSGSMFSNQTPSGYYNQIHKSNQNNSSDAFIMAFSSNTDELKWSTYFGGKGSLNFYTNDGSDKICDGEARKQSKLYMVGQTSSDINFPLKKSGPNAYFQSSLPGGGSSLVSGFDISNALSSRENIIDNNYIFKIYPTPAKRKLNIKIYANDLNPSSLEVASMKGEIILRKDLQLEREQYTINIGDLESGTYIIKLKNEESSIIKKFVK